MPYVFLAALVLLVVIVIVNWAANADAATIKRFGRYMGAFLMVAAAAFVAARGAIWHSRAYSGGSLFCGDRSWYSGAEQVETSTRAKFSG
jgi:hypothetical protein